MQQLETKRDTYGISEGTKHLYEAPELSTKSSVMKERRCELPRDTSAWLKSHFLHGGNLLSGTLWDTTLSPWPFTELEWLACT